ncbi:translation initiation factor IF-2 [Paenibacillus sp. YN15]|uniref:translation initiation factor IF-2 n=1 Tax=Paenibacillus sp. YN15 TaxID=1742774 RepID=UPI000DCEE412|nr:translation initiation factor IF-2 [Paenibacillus sp. YN15]RAV03551.1 translation initiation factor IF-2 [Paenibacillus sp. YN15]
MTKQDKQDNKDKLRVYEYAKTLNMSSKEIITILKRQGITVNNHMSVLEPNMVGSVEQFFRDVKANAAAKRVAESSGNVAASTPPASEKKQASMVQAQPAKTEAPAANAEAAAKPQQSVESAAPAPRAPEASAAPAERREGQGSGGQGGYQRREGQGSGGQGGYQRREGQGSGGQGGYQRREGQGSGGQGGYQRREGQGSGSQGGYQRREGQGSGGQGGQGGYQRREGQGSGGQGGQGGYQRREGQGSGGQGGQGGYQRREGQGGGGQGGQGGYQRRDGQGSGSQGGQGGYQRREGQGGQGGQGGYQRREGQGGQGGQGGYQRRDGQSGGQGGYQRQGSQGGQGGQGGFQRRDDRGPGLGAMASALQSAGAPVSSSPTRRNNDRDKNRGEHGRNDYQARKPVQDKPIRVPTNVSADDDIVLDLPAAGAAKVGGGKRSSKPAPKRSDDRGGNRFGRGRNQQQTPVRKEKIDNTPKKVIVRGTMTVGEFAKLLHKDVSELIKKLLFLGVMATINQELDLDTIQLLANDYGVEVELKIPVDETNIEATEENDDPADLLERPPVVTIMGHVDHGKTTLLDAIRHTNVSEGEAGGITQHIGAYQVEINGRKITFLDTPGHEAFTSMRARGAQVTDITILVVAADDGVMPQTKEAIAHAKAAKVPIIVAVNKIDKPDSNPDRIKQELMEFELVAEEWGGDTIFANISAKQRMGLENLLEMILLVADVQELKANPNKRARGTVIEAELDKGKGPVARVLVQNGTLKVGDSFIAGNTFGRVRAMVNDKGKRLKEAGPSTPVEITGLTEVPQAGDMFLAFEDERKAREIADKRTIQQRQADMGANTRVTLDDLFKQIKEGEIKDLNVIIKGDVQGSVEALRGSLEKIEVEGARVKILHAGVGAITESDIILASASNAIIIGFNVRPEPAALATAEQEKVDIRLHRVIYKVIEEIESAMKGLLDPVFKESVIGQAEVRNTFKISKVGTIAGCMVISGKITRSAEARIIRQGIVVYEGKIDSLKRFKDDAKEVAQGYECGITLDRFNDLKEGDIIEAFIMESVER